MSKYFTDSEIRRLVAETEAELDARNAAALEQQRMQAITAWINDPKNKATIDNDPMVKKLRAMGSPPASPRTAPQPVQHTVAPAPTPYKSRQQLEKERPWLAPRKPELESVIDPYCGRRQDRIRIG
jgi:hypothetical protein